MNRIAVWLNTNTNERMTVRVTSGCSLFEALINDHRDMTFLNWQEENDDGRRTR